MTRNVKRSLLPKIADSTGAVVILPIFNFKIPILKQLITAAFYRFTQSSLILPFY